MESSREMMHQYRIERNEASKNCVGIVDDALNYLQVEHELATIREVSAAWKHASILVGWKDRAGIVFVAVHSYLDVALTFNEACELATDIMVERGMIIRPTSPDFFIR